MTPHSPSNGPLLYARGVAANALIARNSAFARPPLMRRAPRGRAGFFLTG